MYISDDDKAYIYILSLAFIFWLFTDGRHSENKTTNLRQVSETFQTFKKFSHMNLLSSKHFYVAEITV